MMKNSISSPITRIDGLAASTWATVHALYDRAALRQPQAQLKPAALPNSAMSFGVTRVKGNIPVTILRLKGNLDYSTYREVIAVSRQLYESGVQNLLLDLQAVPSIGLSGLFALYSAALLFQGRRPPDPEEGIPALQTMADEISQTHLNHFRLLKPVPGIKKMLAANGLPVDDNLAAALASFG